MNTQLIFPKGEWRKALQKACVVLTIISMLLLNLTIPVAAAITPGNSTTATSGSGYTVTIAKPGSTAAGDVLVACIVATSAYANRPTVTPPENWQLIRHTDAAQGWNYDMLTYYKVAGSSEPADYTWSSTHLNTSGAISRLTGVDINHVVDVSAEAQGQGVNPATATAPSVTTTFANDIVINFFGSYSPVSLFFESLTMDSLYEYTPPVSGGYNPPSLAAYSFEKVSNGSTSAESCNLFSTVANVNWVTQTVAFKAAPRAYFPATATSAAETATSHSVGITLAPNAEGPVEINFTVSGTAKAGTDYTLNTPSPVTASAGAGSASIEFSILEDDLYENDETIVITLTGGQEYFLTTNTQYTYTIVNDLPAPTAIIAAGNSTTGISPDSGSAIQPPAYAQVLQMNKPTETVAGDFLLAAISWHSGSASVIPTPAGWNLIRTSYHEGIRVATFYRITDSSDGGTSVYTFSIPDPNSMYGWHATGGITRYTGVDTVTPIDTSAGAGGAVNYGGTIAAPQVYPSYSNSRLITVFGTYHPVGNISAPAGMTERYEVHHHIDPNNTVMLFWPGIAMSDMNWLPATGTGEKTVTITGNSPTPVGSDTDWAAQTIALKTSRLFISDLSVTEGNSGSAVANVTVSLDHPTNVPVTFNWLTANGTAVASFPNVSGDDYMVSGENSRTIDAGSTSCTLAIPVIGDTTLESNEDFYVNISSVSGATIADSQGKVTILNNDSSVAINDVTLSEGNAGRKNFVFTATLSPACQVPVSVNYFTPSDGTAIQGTDYVYTAGTLEFAALETSMTITVPVIGDTVFEADVTFDVFLSSAVNAIIVDDRGRGTITNDDAPTPTLTINDRSLTEGNSGSTNMVFTVTLSNASASLVSVNYTNANGTATAGSDYTLTTGTMNIAAGQTSGTISVPILGDTAYEQDESFTLTLSNPGNATINDGSGTGTITNDDALTVAIGDVSQAEGNSDTTNFVFTVTLNGACASAVSVDYGTVNGTAMAGPDYNDIASATLNFSAGESSKTFTIQVNGETAYEPDENFFVNLTNAVGATITDAQAVGTIVNDDAMPRYTLTLAASPSGGGSAADLTEGSPYLEGAAVSLSASPAAGYLFVNWTAPAGSFANASAAITTFTMPAAAALVTANFVLDTRTVTFNAMGGSAVADQAVIPGGLVTRPADPIRSGFAFAGWYKTASYADDWDFAADTVTANTTLYARWAVQDQIQDYSGVSFATGGVTYGQTFTAGMTGRLYKVSCYLRNTASFTLTTEIRGVTASDTPNGTVLASTDTSVPSGSDRWVDITLAEPLPVTAGGRYSIVWSGMPESYTTYLYGSTVNTYGGGQARQLFFSSWVPFTYQDICFRTFVLTTPGITVSPYTGLITTETGATDSFTVVLDTQPSGDVTVALASSDTTEGTASPASLTFTAANWSTPQTVTITGVDDSLFDGNIAYTIDASASSDDPGYQGLTAGAAVTNTDVEGIAPAISADPVSQSITYGASASFTAAATGSPAPSVQWQVSMDGGSSYSDISNGGIYSGATSTTLSLTRPPVSYSTYRYRAVFTNGMAPNATTSAAALTVGQLAITGSFTAASKVYDGDASAVVTGRFLTGVLSGDTVSLIDGMAVFANRHAAAGKTVSLLFAELSGASAGNYSLASVATTIANITPKPVTPWVVANGKTYDGTTAASLGSQGVSGVVSVDTVDLIVGSASFASADAGTWTVTASSLSLGGPYASNYSLSTATATSSATITPLGLTISGAVANDKTYDSTVAATVNFTGASLVGMAGSDSVSINSSGYSATFASKTVGPDKPVTVLGVALSGADAGNYTVSQPAGLTADIGQMDISGSFTTQGKVYDRSTAAVVTGRSLIGALPGDTVTLTGGTAAFADWNAGPGKTVTLTGAALSGDDAANYRLTSVAATTADITPKQVTPWVVANGKAYDGTTAAALSSQGVSGEISPDTVNLIVGHAQFASANVGTWSVTASSLSLGGADAGNYTLSALTATGSATITPLGLTISGAVANDKTYDGTVAAPVSFSSATLVGVAGSDSVSINSSGYSATFANQNVGLNKPVTVLGVALSGADAGNYTVSQPLGLTATIGQLDISGSFTAADKVYDGTTAAIVIERALIGALADDTVALTGGTAAFEDWNAGPAKTVTLTGAALAGDDAGNYRLASVATAAAAITPKPVTPAVVANGKTYDGTTTATLSSQNVSGAISPDVVTLVVGSAHFANADAGTWTVTASSLSLGGPGAGNYSLSALTATGSATITPLGLTISGAIANDKTYDGTIAATVNFMGANLVGMIAGDSVGINSSGYSATFADRNVGLNKPLTVLGVALSGDDAGNYTVSQPAGLTADIGQLGISGSFTAADKIYDGTTAADVAERMLIGARPGDAVILAGGTAAFSDRNAAPAKTVTLTGAALSGDDAGNYRLTSVGTATADITARPIDVTAVADTKVYDGDTDSDETPAITSTPGLATGDSAVWNQTFDTKDAGTGKVLTPAGTVNDGNGGDNYSVTFIPVSTGAILKAELTATAENKTSQYSDPRQAFTVAWSGFITGETLTTSGVAGTPSYATDPELSDPVTQVAGYYRIIPSLGTLAAGNYSFLFTEGTYSVTKEDAALAFDSQNPVSVSVVTAGSNSNAFTWKVSLAQVNDGYRGDLSKIAAEDITLTFSPVGGGSSWTDHATEFDPASGVATFNIPALVLKVETYSVDAALNSNNAYFTATPVENVLVVYDPSLGFTTGGGWFTWPAGTANPLLAGAKTNFGFTLKYNRKGTGTQGSFLLIAHLADGGIIRIKSNAISGLAIIQSTYPGIASFSGKCVYTRLDALGYVLAQSGNQDFNAYAKDMNEPGLGTDLFWFSTKLTIAGEIPFSLDRNGNRKADGDEYVAIGGGNILVPHRASR